MSPRWKRFTALLLGGWVILHVAILWQERDLMARGYGDFAAFYTAGTLVRGGEGHLLYDRPAQWRVQQQFASTVEIRRGPLPFLRPPFEALVFAPLSAFRYPVAVVVWMLFKLACLFAMPFLWRRFIPLPQTFPPWLSGLLCLGFFPIFSDLLQGQDAILFLFLVGCALISVCCQKEGIAGVFLALALIKFHLAIPIVFVFVLRARWRVVAGFFATASALLLISLRIAGWPALRAYPGYLWGLNRMPGAGVITWRSMPNLRALLTAGFAHDPASPWIVAAVLFSGVAALVWVSVFWRRNTHHGALTPVSAFSLTLIVVVLASYYAYNYDLAVALIPLLLLAETAASNTTPRSTRLLFFGAASLMLLSPVYWFLMFTVNRFYLMALVLLVFAAALTGITKLRLEERQA